ncbi:ER membrane protein complex subunit 4 [Lutzomyia longipalpis]|uniref:ER membrane protein complex subunit 4 n=1 Tax=Lutzomyia longipalpis TaxID=7200 RepID=A0A7G3ADZ1_LUTLO|nr:ER membrane protein complex subunit 4 [Lutzomyia longipalpis]
MSSKSASKKFKWSLDYTSRSVARNADIASPPGYNPTVGQSHSEVAKDTDQNHLIMKKSWDIALGPIKQVPMNLLIMYMSGNSISIFPIMMVGMMLIRPIKALFSTGATFKVIEGTAVAGQKFVFLLGNLVNMGLALYKCHSMGLLPTHASDWLAFVEPQSRLEFSGGGLSFQ